MASFVSDASQGHEPALGVGAAPATASGSFPLTLTRGQRANITALSTVLAAGFLLCLAIATTAPGGASSADGRTTDPTVAVPGWSMPGLVGEIALGALFVLSGILVTHRHVSEPESRATHGSFARLVTSGAATFGPGLLLALVLQNPSEPSPVLTAFCTVLPAWAIGCLAMTALSRWRWTRAHASTVIPVLLAITMWASCVLGASAPEWRLLIGGFAPAGPVTDAGTTDLATLRASVLCILHLITYFLAGSLLVARGGGLAESGRVQRFLVPVLGTTLFALSVPLAMGGMDFGQPFLALALAPLIALPMPSFLAGRDVWVGVVAYGWPVHTVLLAPAGTGWDRGTTVVLAGLITAVLAGLSWFYIQRPVFRVMRRVRWGSTETADRFVPPADLASRRPARFRLLDALENEQDSTARVRTEASRRIQ